MTTLATKTICVLFLMGTFAASGSATANDSFNKYAPQTSASQANAFQATAFEPANIMAARMVVTPKGIKRVVKPLPNRQRLELSMAADDGTQSLEKGFNKMQKRSVSRARPMRVFVDQRANTAR